MPAFRLPWIDQVTTKTYRRFRCDLSFSGPSMQCFEMRCVFLLYHFRVVLNYTNVFRFWAIYISRYFLVNVQTY